MKRALLASILGLVASLDTSYGQGDVLFSTYFDSSHIVSVGPGPFFAPNLTATLLYGLGSEVSLASMRTLASCPVGSQLPGVVTDGVVTIPDYTSGPITFALIISSPLGWSGFMPVIWTEPSIQVVPSPANPWTYSLLATSLPTGGVYGGAYIPITPEPGTAALAGLGVAALLSCCRSQETLPSRWDNSIPLQI